MTSLLIILELVLLFAISSFSSLVDEIHSTSNQNNMSDVNDIQQLDNEIILLSDLIENRIEKAAAILELTSRLPEMRALPFLNQFSSTLHGIPPNADMEKRQIGQELLSKYHEEFVAFLYLMPNGTVYLLEPYARQQNLSTSDVSHRDYYKGVIETKDTFLGNVITSLSSGRNQAQLVVPIFDSEDGSNNANASLIGTVSSGLNFETFNKILQSINLGNQERIVLLDSNGTKIADSDTKQQSSLLKSIEDTPFRYLQSFKNAVKGEIGTLTETINGSYADIQYTPVKAVQNNWVLLSFRGSESSSIISTFSNSTQTENNTMKIPSNGTLLNSNATNESSSLNATVPEQVDPRTLNGSIVGKI
jgi:hypothetical protein